MPLPLPMLTAVRVHSKRRQHPAARAEYGRKLRPSTESLLVTPGLAARGEQGRDLCTRVSGYHWGEKTLASPYEK